MRKSDKGSNSCDDNNFLHSSPFNGRFLKGKVRMGTINENYKGFEFPENFIKSRTNENGDFILRIGWRELHLDKDAEFIGSGKDLELLEKYKIFEN